MNQCIGIDLGGSGFRIGLVDVIAGTIVDEPVLVEHTPSTPRSKIIENISSLLDSFPRHVPLGIGFPGVVEGHIVKTAPNLGTTWEDVDFRHHFGFDREREVAVLNDADAAGLCEARFGAGQEKQGKMLMVTVGTGLGTAVLTSGVLTPNVELGISPHPIHGGRIEDRASARAKLADGLSFRQWSKVFEDAINLFIESTSADFVILSGSILKDWNEFEHLIQPSKPIFRAKYHDTAGIIGAAYFASANYQKTG